MAEVSRQPTLILPPSCRKFSFFQLWDGKWRDEIGAVYGVMNLSYGISRCTARKYEMVFLVSIMVILGSVMKDQAIQKLYIPEEFIRLIHTEYSEDLCMFFKDKQRMCCTILMSLHVTLAARNFNPNNLSMQGLLCWMQLPPPVVIHTCLMWHPTDAVRLYIMNPPPPHTEHSFHTYVTP